MHSENLTNSVALDLLLTVRPKHSMTDKVVRGLIQSRGTARWETTLENAWAIKSLGKYYNSVNLGDTPLRGRVWIDDRIKMVHSFEGGPVDFARMFISLRDLSSGEHSMVIDREGPGVLVYRIRLTTVPVNQDLPAWDSGVSISKSYEWEDNEFEIIDGTLIVPLGSYIKVTLTVETGDRRYYVAIEDPQPAGFEIVDFGHDTSNPYIKRSLDLPSFFYHQELYDDRALFFTDELSPGTWSLSYFVRTTTAEYFSAGATTVSEMYNPGVFGRTESLNVQVVNNF